MLVFLVVWRDSRALKLKQIVKDIDRIEQIAGEVGKVKNEAEKLLAATKRHQDQSLAQLESQLKQMKNSLAQLEQRGGNNNDKQRERSQRPQQHQERQQQNKNRSRGDGRDMKAKEHNAAKAEKQEKGGGGNTAGEKEPRLYDLNGGNNNRQPAQAETVSH
jgi:TolA-binding protein